MILDHPLLATARQALDELRWLIGPAVHDRFSVQYSLRDDMGPRAGLTTRLTPDLYSVELNVHVLLRSDEPTTRLLVQHELAHVVDDVVLGWGANVHGQSWQTIMGLLGHQSPAACHGVDVRDLADKDRVPMAAAVCLRCGAHGALSQTQASATSVRGRLCGGALRRSPGWAGSFKLPASLGRPAGYFSPHYSTPHHTGAEQCRSLNPM
jgi:predicted SprT family Zn-dependent metalloprotease